MGALTKFERTEKKYLLNAAQFDALCRGLSGRMTIDQYGEHTISNIYYDTDDWRLVRASIEKPCYKEKLRVRAYKTPKADSTVFVELKKKCGGVVYKRREQMTLLDSDSFLSDGKMPEHPSQIMKEIAYFTEFYKPVPKVFIAYDRIALYANADPGFRLTFDHNLRYRLTALDLSKGDWGTPIRDGGFYIMEVKLCSGMPMWFSKLLSQLCIFPGSFSKYGTVYKEVIAPAAHLKGEEHCA